MAGEVLRQLLAIAEVTQRSEVDSGVARRRDLIQDLSAFRHIWQDPDCQLERAIAHRGVGDADRASVHERPWAGAGAGSEGRSNGLRLRWTPTIASHTAMS